MEICAKHTTWNTKRNIILIRSALVEKITQNYTQAIRLPRNNKDIREKPVFHVQRAGIPKGKNWMIL